MAFFVTIVIQESKFWKIDQLFILWPLNWSPRGSGSAYILDGASEAIIYKYKHL